MSRLKRAQISFLDHALFSFARVASTIGLLIALAGLALGILRYWSIEESTWVSHKEVRRTLNPPQDALSTVIPQTNLPANVEKYIRSGAWDLEAGRDNREVFLGWLDNLKESQKSEFILNLSDVIAVAEKQSDDIIDVIKRYKDLKLHRLGANLSGKYEEQASKAATVAFIIATMMLTVLMSLVLVLLAIERNTRLGGSSVEDADG